MIKNKIILILIILTGLVLSAPKERMITIGGCVTETVFELGAGGFVVAVDQSSATPIKVKELPQVGYIRAISSEGILSMMPTKILTTTDMGPKKVVEQIQDSGVNLEIFKSPHSFDEILNLVDQIAEYLDLSSRGDSIKNQMKSVKNQIDKIKSDRKHIPKIAFFMNPTSNSYNAAGVDTRADYLIEFLGGSNIFKSGFSRYKKVTSEEIINLKPDIILVGSIRSDSKLSDSVFLTNPAFRSVPAVSNEKIIYLDMGKYLTFGPNFVNHVLSLMGVVSIEDE